MENRFSERSRLIRAILRAESGGGPGAGDPDKGER
jgi:hypothetical protein